MKKLTIGILGLAAVAGMLSLASYLISYPDDALRFAKRYGMWIWFAAFALCLARYLRRKWQLKEWPIQSPQRNAGSRPSSNDSSASETPSSLGPRG